MVGETRDTETARLSVRAAIAGHAVYSTLHTRSAIGAVSRLIDLGVEPYLLADALAALVAQRLLRKVCPLVRWNARPRGRKPSCLARV